MNIDEIDVGFQAAQYVRLVERMREQREAITNPDHWRRLNPDLTISANPFDQRRPLCEVAAASADAHLLHIREEGYFHTPPLLAPDETARLADGIGRVVHAGFPASFVCVYDEFYQAFDRLGALLAPILGDGYLMVAEGFGAWHIEGGDTESRLFGPAGPHRDSLGPDRHDLARENPTLVNAWIPLTDATLDNSCIYLLPAHRDPSYLSSDRKFLANRVPFQHIRAVPAAAGSVVCWTTHLLHWGSRGSRRAGVPRMSIAMYLQSRAVPPYDESAFPVPSAVPFTDRLHWIALTLRDPKIFDFP